MKLFFDTETTGLVNFNIPFDEQTSRMVQLGMILLHDDGTVAHEVGLIIRPDGYTIPPFVSDIHGITQSTAEKTGISINTALLLFKELMNKCDTYVGHNIKFDQAIVASEMRRTSWEYQTKPTFCTMLESTPVCKLPSKRGYKWPKLSEAYKYFFNEELVDAHDALTDVRATVRIYKELVKITQGSMLVGSSPLVSHQLVNDHTTSPIHETYKPQPTKEDIEKLLDVVFTPLT